MHQVPESSRPLVEDIRLEKDGTMVAAVKVHGNAGQIRMVPRKADNVIEWTCATSPEIRKYVPATCRP